MHVLIILRAVAEFNQCSFSTGCQCFVATVLVRGTDTLALKLLVGHALYYGAWRQESSLRGKNAAYPSLAVRILSASIRFSRIRASRFRYHSYISSRGFRYFLEAYVTKSSSHPSFGRKIFPQKIDFTSFHKISFFGVSNIFADGNMIIS